MKITAKGQRRYSKKEQREFCCRLADEKMSVPQLAKEINVSEQTIRNWLKKNVEPVGVVNAESRMGLEVNFSAINEAPRQQIYTLEEGAASIGITAEQLLHYASLGKVRLCFPVRPELNTISSATLRKV